MREPLRIVLPREVLLVELDRHCFFPDCETRASVGITKSEACSYRGFRCLACQRWNDDFLTEKDVPEWWPEIKPQE